MEKARYFLRIEENSRFFVGQTEGTENETAIFLLTPLTASSYNKTTDIYLIYNIDYILLIVNQS